MSKKRNSSIGIDIDNQSIRATRISTSGQGKDSSFIISTLAELSGNFIADQEISEGLKKIRQKLSISLSEPVITCLGGKQTYAAEMHFRKLPEEEMRNALKFEIRKNLPFEVNGSTLEYQFLNNPEKKSETVPVMVAAVSNVLLNRHLKINEKAGLHPRIVDLLPLAIANAFWIDAERTEDENTRVIMHIGPEFTTLVIDGQSETFYNRTIYFAAGELFGEKRDENIAMREQERRITGFTEEVSRSLAYYENTFGSSKFSVITVLGNFIYSDLMDALTSQTGLTIEPLDLVRKFRAGRESIPGKFDLSIALALRNGG